MLKQDVLMYFENNKGKVVSGAFLAEFFNVSRNAIWKIVSNLRQEGYDIVATTNAGYVLNENSDILSEIKIRKAMKCDAEIILLKCVESTMKEALKLVNEKTFCVVVSDEQKSGMSYTGDVFLSPQSKGIYLTVLKAVDCSHEDAIKKTNNFLQMLGGQLERIVNKSLQTKEDFGIYCNDKKICTTKVICVEDLLLKQCSNIIVGVGINVYAESEFGTNSAVWTSLFKETNKYQNRSELVAQIVDCFCKAYVN